MKVIFEEMR